MIPLLGPELTYSAAVTPSLLGCFLRLTLSSCLTPLAVDEMQQRGDGSDQAWIYQQCLALAHTWLRGELTRYE